MPGSNDEDIYNDGWKELYEELPESMLSPFDLIEDEKTNVLSTNTKVYIYIIEYYGSTLHNAGCGSDS